MENCAQIAKSRRTISSGHRANNRFNSARIGELLQPELRQIVAEFDDAVSVGTLQGDDVV